MKQSIINYDISLVEVDMIEDDIEDNEQESVPTLSHS